MLATAVRDQAGWTPAPSANPSRVAAIPARSDAQEHRRTSAKPPCRRCGVDAWPSNCIRPRTLRWNTN